MRQKFLSFRIAMAIVAMAIVGVVVTSCSRDDDMLNNVELQSDDDVSAESRLKSGGDAIVAGVTYSCQLERHYGGSYPGYAYTDLNFSSVQLYSTEDWTEETDSTVSLPVGDMLTFFNQTAYKNGSSKGCPGFIINEDYDVANYTAEVSTELGYDSLYTLTKSEIENADLDYYTDDPDDYDLPFLKSTHSGQFSGGNLQQNLALTYYDNNLQIGHEYHIECSGTYTTPIWVITDGVDYWAFCVDPYKTVGNTYYSTFCYKKLN